MNSLARTYHEKHEKVKAEKHYLRALKIDKFSFYLLNNIAGFYREELSYNKAIDYYKQAISVNPNNFETSKKGIFAAGDICNYPGKLKLILSGFHEVALASVECFKRARPNEKYRFEFTTSSKTIQDRLGKK